MCLMTFVFRRLYLDQNLIVIIIDPTMSNASLWASHRFCHSLGITKSIFTNKRFTEKPQSFVKNYLKSFYLPFKTKEYFFFF